ncbi:hypothetical protein PCYB_007720 [Plasmodium cynomolgi strain B]|uniref:CYIR protein n=1 Tax=Plasmodium cynomolgi (strain B) TaxID=1120755 RepID=K6UP30_PLACD|nr:hypothetical protein PCYB_007720 [Plasmodium cynomolgi strain B]GAB70023.1 hypothetical protein PCYB_007720 [Plasmodium cynomolgi strain B]
MNVRDKMPFLYLCNNNIKNYNDILAYPEIMDICIKYLRNLKLLHSLSYKKDDFDKYCNNIYYWLYYEIKELTISEDSIKGIFNASTSIEKEKNKSDDCSDLDLYKDWNNTEKLVMLQIFNHNIDVILEILNNKCDSNRTSCKNLSNNV